MSDIDNYDKKKLIILRAVLIIIGAAIGYLALWQYFQYYPIVRREYQIVIAVVSAALAALILALSAKAFYRLIAGIVSSLYSLAARVGTRGIIGVVLGLALACALSVGFDFLIKLFIDIWAVRLLTDVLVFIVCAAVGCLVFTRLLNMQKKQKAAPPKGYMIAAECFTDERVITAACTLIDAKVLDGAYKALALYGGDGGAEAVRLLDALVAQGRLSIVKSGKEFTDVRSYAEIETSVAKSKRLRLVNGSNIDGGLSIDVFAPPAAELKQGVCASDDQHNDEHAEQTDDKVLGR